MTYVDALFFAVFVPLVTLCRLLPWIRLREAVIMAVSIGFLAAWGHVSLFVFLAVAGANYLASVAIERLEGSASRRVLGLVIVGDLAALGWFKYRNFVASAIGVVPAEDGLALPLAISFYSFHLISYLVDLQARRVQRAGLRQYLFYLSFFPHLVAGPIVRAWQFMPQIGKRRASAGDVPVGLYQLAAGAFLKSVLADNIGQLIDPVWDGSAGFTPSGIDRFLVALLYYAQIYADFAGYSLMALGMSRLLGYRLPANFRRPMFAASLQEFWRRWHMTLSRWLRDYLYKPLGGSHGGAGRTAGNLLATMVLGGLWHGAGWTFLLWGALHGAGLVVERLAGLNRSRGVMRAAWFVAAQLWITIAWVFFRAPDLPAALSFLRGLAEAAPDGLILHPAIGLGCAFGLAVIAHQAVERGLVWLPHRRVPLALGVSTALFCVADLVVFAPAKVFIYFKF
jgi:alginate O-acetyltransferase complex protein AlgI